MSSYACCVEKCGGTICLTDELETRLRRTHEWFHCPFGHRQHFGGQTRDEKRIASLERQLQAERRVRDRWREHHERASRTFGTCPLCGWETHSGIENRWYWLLKHMAGAHKDEGGWELFVAFQEARTERRRSA